MAAFRVEFISVEGALPWVEVLVGVVTAGFRGRKLAIAREVKLAFRENDPYLKGQREVSK